MNKIYENIELCIKTLENSENVAIAGHTSPDGDAICASLSLAMTLKKMGKNPIILLENYADTYDYVKGHDMVYKGDYDKIDVDLFISVDCGDVERMGKAKQVFDRTENTINIDHHVSNNNFAKLNIVNTKASSTSEIIFEILNPMGAIDLDVATAIYTGIVYDTSGFKHISTAKRTHQIAGELIGVGVDSSTIHRKLLHTHTLENSRVLARVIQNLEIYDNKVISCISKDEIINDCKATCKDTEGIVGYLLDIKGMDVAVFLYEKMDGTIKASFRANSVNVNEIAKSFGGGGHILASGATLDMSLEEAKKQILEKLKNI